MILTALLDATVGLREWRGQRKICTAADSRAYWRDAARECTLLRVASIGMNVAETQADELHPGVDARPNAEWVIDVQGEFQFETTDPASKVNGKGDKGNKGTDVNEKAQMPLSQVEEKKDNLPFSLKDVDLRISPGEFAIQKIKAIFST